VLLTHLTQPATANDRQPLALFQSWCTHRIVCRDTSAEQGRSFSSVKCIRKHGSRAVVNDAILLEKAVHPPSLHDKVPTLALTVVARTTRTFPTGMVGIDKADLIAFGESSHRRTKVDNLSATLVADGDCFRGHYGRGAVENHLYKGQPLWVLISSMTLQQYQVRMAEARRDGSDQYLVIFWLWDGDGFQAYLDCVWMKLRCLHRFSHACFFVL